MALYTGSPVVLSQTSAVSRWLVIPTATMSEALRSPLAKAPAVTDRVLSQISLALCSTQPARGKICSCSFWSDTTTRPAWLKIMHRVRSEEHTSELQSRLHLVCRLLLEKKKKKPTRNAIPHIK